MVKTEMIILFVCKTTNEQIDFVKCLSEPDGAVVLSEAQLYSALAVTVASFLFITTKHFVSEYF